jgi:hypothetical protein
VEAVAVAVEVMVRSGGPRCGAFDPSYEVRRLPAQGRVKPTAAVNPSRRPLLPRPVAVHRHRCNYGAVNMEQ